MPKDETQEKKSKTEYPNFEKMSYAEILVYIDKEAKKRLKQSYSESLEK